MNDHGNKKAVVDSLTKSSRCRYRNVRPHSLPAESHSFVGMARETAAMPPASVLVEKGGESGKVGGGEPLARGLTHTTSRNRRKKPKQWRTDLFSKTACALAGRALFGRIVGSALLPQRWRCEVEMCMYRWRGVLKLSRTEPSAGYRRWCGP